MRWLAIFCFSVSLSIFALVYGAGWMLFAAAALSLLLLLAGLTQTRRKRTAAFVAAAGIAFGCCYTVCYDGLLCRPAEKFIDTEQSVRLTLCDVPQKHTFGAKVTALMDTGAPLPAKVQFYGSDALLDASPGDTVMTTARLQSAKTINGTAITSFSSKGIFLLAYGKGEMTVEPLQGFAPQYFPVRLRGALQEKVADYYDGEVRILMTALLSGDRTEFDDVLYSTLSETGMTHVTAVSGMHCAVLFGMVRLLVRNRRRAVIAGLPILVLFALMTGAAPSVVRACVMIALLSAAPLFRRENDSITSMGAALLLILLPNPYAAQSIGLQLSFLSVTGLLLFSDPFYRGMGKLLRGAMRFTAVRMAVSGLCATWAASLLTLPLAAYYFGCVSLIAPLSNLLCLWAVTFAFCGGLLSVAVGCVFPPVASVLAVFPAAALEYFLAVAHLTARVPFHALYTNNPLLPYWIVYFYGMLAVVLLRKGRGRVWVEFTALSLASLCLVVALPIWNAAHARLTVSVIDVGQGECVLMASGGKTAVLDCGSSNSWINAGAQAANEINTRGVTRLDYMILTHYHNDHANGVETLFSRVGVDVLVVPNIEDEDNRAAQEALIEIARRYGTEVVLIDAERSLPLGSAELTLYPPLGRGNTNEEGLSLLCTCGDFDALVTGDMDSDTERLLLEKAGLPDIELLVVGHHGSKYSTSAELLQAVTPKTAVIPVGTNSYGHPTEETLRRLDEAGIAVHRTDYHGTVSIAVH